MEINLNKYSIWTLEEFNIKDFGKLRQLRKIVMRKILTKSRNKKKIQVIAIRSTQSDRLFH